MNKLEHLEGSEWRNFIYPDVWAFQETTGPDRLVIAPSSRQVQLMQILSHSLGDPFGILYELLVPHGGYSAGRFQNPDPVTGEVVETFLQEFEEYFERDGRHNIWISSLDEEATLVYDQHNLIYAYGPLERYKSILTEQGLKEMDHVSIPAPHAHSYHSELDEWEDRIRSLWDWIHFPHEDSS